MNGPRPPCFVTTSWDDGHPCDLRIADLLARYELPGTFYIPAASQHWRMAMHHIRDLADTFDVGAHTLRHLNLNGLPDSEASAEITGSKDFIEQTTGRTCRVFAPPLGRFRMSHVRAAEQAGFWGFRTTELMNLNLPEVHGGMAMMTTTLQLFRHPWQAYWKNALRRLRPVNLYVYLRHGKRRDLHAAFESLLTYAIQHGGVLHLWGHSWEIEERGDWDLLAGMLERLAAHRNELRLVSNSLLCDLALADGHLTLAVSNSVLP